MIESRILQMRGRLVLLEFESAGCRCETRVFSIGVGMRRVIFPLELTCRHMRKEQA